VRTELIAIDRISARDSGHWRELAERAVEPNPFFEPDFLLPAWRELGSTAVRLLVLRGGEGWQGCMPVSVERMHRGPRCLTTWQHSYLFLGTPLVDRDCVDSFAAILADSARRRDHHRLLALQSVGDGAVLGAIRAAVAEKGGPHILYEEEFERAALRRRQDPDYMSNLSARHRREMKRLQRRLGEELGGEVATVERSVGPEALDDFLRLEASGWKGREGTAMAADGGTESFFRQMCEGFAAAGRLQLLSLETDGRVAAMKCNVSAGDTLFCFKIAYDDELRQYSPGILLEAANIGVFHERRDEQLMDSCAQPGNKMINRLWTDRRRLTTIVLGRRGPSRLTLGLAGAAARWRRERRNNA
jgi:CelD/BcsL family acetyltransferase involved in cellulose biosynthesis